MIDIKVKIRVDEDTDYVALVKYTNGCKLRLTETTEEFWVFEISLHPEEVSELIHIDIVEFDGDNTFIGCLNNRIMIHHTLGYSDVSIPCASDEDILNTTKLLRSLNYKNVSRDGHFVRASKLYIYRTERESWCNVKCNYEIIDK